MGCANWLSRFVEANRVRQRWQRHVDAGMTETVPRGHAIDDLILFSHKKSTLIVSGSFLSFLKRNVPQCQMPTTQAPCVSIFLHPVSVMLDIEPTPQNSKQHKAERSHSRNLPLIPVVVRNQEGQLQRLLLVQPRVAEARVVGGQVVLVEADAAAHALCDGVAGQLEVDAAQVAALLLVDAQRLLQLAEDVAEAPGLDAGGRAPRVAVHRVALPHHAPLVLRVLDRADVRGKQRSHARGAVACYQGYLARLAGGVEGAQELEEVLCWRGGADLDADRVRYPPEELDVPALDLPRAVADPEEVC